MLERVLATCVISEKAANILVKELRGGTEGLFYIRNNLNIGS